MINNNMRKTTASKEKFIYTYLIDLIRNSDPELKKLEHKYNIVGSLADESIVRIATMPDEYIDKELTDADEDEIIEEIKEELNYRIEKLFTR